MGVIIIFFTYFKKDNEQKLEIIENKTEVEDDIKEGLNTFKNIEYEGKDANDNKFIINSEYAEFTSEKTNIIYMKKMFCNSFLKTELY